MRQIDFLSCAILVNKASKYSFFRSDKIVFEKNEIFKSKFSSVTK